MVLSERFLLVLQCASFLTIFLVQAQNQTGFISIDCGASQLSYTDEQTGLTYLSDKNFIQSGENWEILSTYKATTDEKQFWNVRSFPHGTRNCYTLEPSNGKDTRYLIRARFMYGNYDAKSKFATFNLYVGVDLWDEVIINDDQGVIDKEVLYMVSSDQVHVCLVNIGFGTPFISVLELRPLETDAYSSAAKILLLKERYDFGSTATQETRYKGDAYDRLWSPLPTNNWTPLNGSVNETISMDKYRVPFEVMSTAYTQNITSNMGLYWENQNTSKNYYFIMYFTELIKLEANQSRELTIYVNEDTWFGPFSPKYLSPFTLHSRGSTTPDKDGKIQIWFNRTVNSTLPPLINAFEVYYLLEGSGQETYQTDLEAIVNIKSEYELEIENWQGDPCSPNTNTWDGLQCSFNDNLPPRITTLNLSSSGLRGKISPYIAKLTALRYLDLSNNSLTGTLPEFLADLTFLKVLNLQGNNLKGPVPQALLEKSKTDLSLSVDASVSGNDMVPSPTNETSTSRGVSHGKNNFIFSISWWVFCAFSAIFVL